jgi:hypothetical protein
VSGILFLGKERDFGKVNLKSSKKARKFFYFQGIANKKLNCIFATLKINKSIWYVCNRRDSRATIQSKQRPKGLRSPFDK